MERIICKTNKYMHNFTKMSENNSGKNKINTEELERCLKDLQEGKLLDKKYKDHKLLNKHYYNSCRCFHLANDILVLYERDKFNLKLNNIGTHSEILGKEKLHRKPKR